MIHILLNSRCARVLLSMQGALCVAALLLMYAAPLVAMDKQINSLSYVQESTSRRQSFSKKNSFKKNGARKIYRSVG